MDETVTMKEFEGRKGLCDERFARDKDRIGETEEALQNLTVLVTQLAEIVKSNVAAQADTETRLRAIEAKPSGWLDKIIWLVVGGVGAWAIESLLK